MKFDCTGVILAGGKNSRLPGKKKALCLISMIIITAPQLVGVKDVKNITQRMDGK